MKVICEKRKEIEIVKSCRKEFCCKKLENAFETLRDKHASYYPNIQIYANKIRMATQSDSDRCNHYEYIDYCPFCGTKLVVENIEIDNTGLPPKRIIPKGAWSTDILNTPKKKHWWQ